MSATKSNIKNWGGMFKIAEGIIDCQINTPQTLTYLTNSATLENFAPFLIVNSPDTGDPSGASTNDFDIGGNGLILTTTSFNPIGSSGDTMTLFCLGPAQGIAFNPSDAINVTVSVSSSAPATVKVAVYGVAY